MPWCGLIWWWLQSFSTPVYGSLLPKSATIKQSVYVTQEGCLTAHRNSSVAAWVKVKVCSHDQSPQHLRNIFLYLFCLREEERSRETITDWLVFTCMCVPMPTMCNDLILHACVCPCEFMCITCKQVPAEARRQHSMPWSWGYRQFWAAQHGC